MATLRAVSPRRLTGAEETELRAAAARLATGEQEVDRLLRERDRLIADIVHAGARITDIADVLDLSRNGVYGAVERGQRD